MAGIIKRGNMWCAQYRVNGKQERKATGIHVKEHHMTARQAQELARATAREMEATARGETPCKRAVDAVRAVAVARGVAAKVPTLREYLASVPRTARAIANIPRDRQLC